MDFLFFFSQANNLLFSSVVADAEVGDKHRDRSECV